MRQAHGFGSNFRLVFSLILAVLLLAAPAALAAAKPAAKAAAKPAPAAPAAEKVGLVQSVEAAFVYNPELKSSQENREAARHAVERARAGFFPRAGIYAGGGVSRRSDLITRAYDESHSFRSFGDAGLRLTQSLWQGGATTAEVKTRSSQLDVADFMLSDRAMSLGFDAVVAHTEVLRRTDMVRAAKENVRQHAEILDTLRRRFETKVATVGELHQVEGRHARAKATLASYESSLDAARANYERITGRAATGSFVPSPAPAKTYASSEEMRRACLDGNPRIRAAVADVIAAEGERDMAKSNFFPSLDLEAGPSWYRRDTSYDSRIADLEAALRLRWEFYSGGADLASVNTAGAKIRQAKQNLHSLLNLLNEDLDATYSRYLSAQVEVGEYERAKKSSRLARQDYYRQFLSAQRSLIDVLDAENDYFYASSQQIMAAGDRVIAGYRLLALTGGLLQELHVDPARLRAAGPTTSIATDGDLRYAFPSPLNDRTGGQARPAAAGAQ